MSTVVSLGFLGTLEKAQLLTVVVNVAPGDRGMLDRLARRLRVVVARQGFESSQALGEATAPTSASASTLTYLVRVPSPDGSRRRVYVYYTGRACEARGHVTGARLDHALLGGAAATLSLPRVLQDLATSVVRCAAGA